MEIILCISIRKLIVCTVLLNSLHILAPQGAVGFGTDTHERINVSAAQNSTLDSFLSIDLAAKNVVFDRDFVLQLQEFVQGDKTGLDASVDGKRVVDWIGIGGRSEDQFLEDIVGQTLGEIAGGVTRSPRHFHTPLRDPWDQAGLNLLGIQVQSSVHWAQNPNQSPGKKASWKDARDAYYSALTGRTKAKREGAWADTFQILGQLMHLVGDLGSTAHTRNDSHLLGDGFETFMADPLNRPLIAGFQGIDPSVLHQPTADPFATVPVARIWDTDTYNGTNPEVTTETTTNGATIGLAEFTSANFFSDDTITRQAFTDPVLPLPAIDRLSPGPVDFYPPTGNRRQYLSKLGEGVAPITHMVAEGIFSRFTPPFVRRHVLDDLVYQDYAQILLPRAIGYSAGLLNYFFRGRMELMNPEHPFACCGAALADNTVVGEGVDGGIRNVTPGEETQGQGRLVAVIPQREGEEIIYHVSTPVAIDLTREFQGDIAFDFANDPIPFVANASDRFCAFVGGTVPCDMHFVYRGPLGQEADAVMVLRSPVDFD